MLCYMQLQVTHHRHHDKARMVARAVYSVMLQVFSEPLVSFTDMHLIVRQLYYCLYNLERFSCNTKSAACKTVCI